MNKTKIKKISNVLSIFQSLNNEDLDYFCLNSNDESMQLFLEVIFNLITNKKISERVKDKNQENEEQKKKWCSIIKSKNNKARVTFIRKQIGSGILADISSLVFPILLALI